MNYSTAIFLINPNTRALSCTYEAGEHAPRTVFKSLDPSINVGDFVLVPTDTRHKMTIVKVMAEIDDFDIDTPTQVAWIIGKVELANYEKLVAAEQEAIRTIQSAERRKKRDEMRKAILADQEAELGALPIAQIGGPVAIENK